MRERAALDWCAWEDAIVSFDSAGVPNPRYDDPRFRMAFARIVTHVIATAPGCASASCWTAPTAWRASPAC